LINFEEEKKFLRKKNKKGDVKKTKNLHLSVMKLKNVKVFSKKRRGEVIIKEEKKWSGALNYLIRKINCVKLNSFRQFV
jgi:hypothetical protein